MSVILRQWLQVCLHITGCSLGSFLVSNKSASFLFFFGALFELLEAGEQGPHTANAIQ